MPRPVPLSVLATVDPLVRDSVILGVVLDAPRTVVVRHDVVTTPDGGGGIRRVVLAADVVLEDVVVPLEHACLGCAVREDAVPTLRRVAADGRWASVLLALPVSAESLAATRVIAPETRPGGELERLRLAAVVSAVDGESVEEDLLGDDLLAERGLELAGDDRRAVGEALAAQVAHADVVLVTGEVPAAASDLIEHLRAGDGARVDGVHRLDPHRLFAHRHDPLAGEGRVDPRRAEPSFGPTAHGVWTLDLRSERPFHPERLLDRIGDLGGGRVRSRGVFWVPTRPHSVCAWDGAGGRLSVGEVGPWGLLGPRTHLVVTGTGGDTADVARRREAFDDALLTDDEWRTGLVSWLGSEDVLAPWLGDRHAA